MNKTPKLCTLSSALVLLGSMAAVAPGAYAQQGGAAPELEEVVVTGSRAAPRTAVDSMAPIDVIGGTEFREQGTTDINDLMRNLVPSFNVEARDISDTQSLVRPNRLRGLPADNTLILVNGKRRHRSSAIQFGNTGTHFVDTSMIPSIALQQLEVLRDGASAQYGSDAIAGVMNFRLKENNEGLTLEYRTGLYTNSSDGESHYIAGNLGLPLGPNGFASISFDTLNQNYTNRAIQRGDAQAVLNRGNIAVLESSRISQTVMSTGLPKVDSINLFVNAGIELSQNQEVYSFGGYSEKTTELGFFYRNPENTGGIFTRPAGSGLPARQFFFDLTPNGTGNCPVIPLGANAQHGTSSLAARAVSQSNPNCFSFAELYPGGYTPQFGADLTDVSNTTGVRGEFGNGTRYDFSLGLGYSKIDYFLYNTTNPSMGPDTPSSFKPGVYETIENTAGVEFVTPVEMAGLSAPLSFAYGAEWRREIFKTSNYDEASWKPGRFISQGANIGANGMQGFGPSQQGVWDRKNFAFYVDMEAEITERLLMGAALRYEDFYDSFGDTTNGKISMRYRLTDTTRLRATASTGFRAPSPGQANISNLATGIVDGVPVAQGQIPPTNPIAQRFGGQVLSPEKSRNFSAGFTTELGPVDVTVDYYNIQMSERILNSSLFTITPAIALELQNSGISGSSDLSSIRYYTNDMDTTNRGIEAVVSYTRSWNNGSRTTFNGSWAWSDQEIDSFTAGLLTEQGRINLTERIPSNRGNFRGSHFIGDLRITAQANYYGKFLLAPIAANRARDYWVDSAVILSTEIGYTFRDNYSFSIGADNLLDKMPPLTRDVDFTATTSNRYLTTTAYSPNGRYVYARVQYDM
jgi:iron complex outermembrane recepter protein